MFDWTQWLGKVFKKIDSILSYQQFKIDANHPGVVACYKTNNGNPDLINVFKVKDPKTYLTTTKPEVIIPEGLSEQRQLYLYNQIREFCTIGTEDYVAPAPTNKKQRKK